jgi:transcriptional regulator with XRE-family HTH domain
MLRERLGMKLRQLRMQQGLNQTAIAKKVRVTQAYIAMLEKGRENPTLDVLERLAKALKVSVGELVE